MIDSLDDLGKEYPELEIEPAAVKPPYHKATGQARKIPIRGQARGKQVSGEGQLTLDVFDKDDELVIKSTIAGVKPEDIDISITNDMVTIKGQRQMDEEVREKDYFYQELYWGSFSRSVILPTEVDADRATAAMKNGILTIRLPKLERASSKKISVTS